ncbi:MAG: AraC family transcriptional regulator [Reinekea sp.]
MLSNQLIIGKRCFDINMAGILILHPRYRVERVNPNELFTSKGQGRLTTTETVQRIEPETMTVIPTKTRWLEQTNWPIAERTAARLGFSDQFNFSDRFPAYTGLSPMAWRKSSSQDNTND